MNLLHLYLEGFLFKNFFFWFKCDCNFFCKFFLLKRWFFSFFQGQEQLFILIIAYNSLCLIRDRLVARRKSNNYFLIISLKKFIIRDLIWRGGVYITTRHQI